MSTLTPIRTPPITVSSSSVIFMRLQLVIVFLFSPPQSRPLYHYHYGQDYPEERLSPHPQLSHSAPLYVHQPALFCLTGWSQNSGLYSIKNTDSLGHQALLVTPWHNIPIPSQLIRAGTINNLFTLLTNARSQQNDGVCATTHDKCLQRAAVLLCRLEFISRLCSPCTRSCLAGCGMGKVDKRAVSGTRQWLWLICIIQ